MKKRILGLALALIMIISLLPLTTFAAAPTKIKVVLYNSGQGHATEPRIDCETQNQTNYIYVEDTTAANHKAVFSTTAQTDNYVKVTYANGVYTMTFKNFNYTNLNDGGSVFYVNTSGEYDINVILEGTNTINARSTALQFNNTGKVTISGDGSLTITNTKASADSIFKNGAGELEIKDVTINVAMGTGTGMRHCITTNGDVTIDGATLDLTAPGGSGIRTASARTSGLVAKNVTIKNNANVKITQAASQSALIANSTGTVTIDNANVELIGNTNNAKVLAAAPTVTGTYSAQKYSVWDPDNSGYSEKNYTAAAFDSNVRYLKFVHEHKAEASTDCTAAVSCACGYAMGAGATAHAGVITDCTKDVPCTNAGCQQKFYTANRTEHEANADDGDCTTAVTCKHCTTVVTPAETKHKDTRTDCSVAGTCANTGCQHAFAAGQHTGGTATCKAKAKCDVCSQEYGNYAACTPAADDGDCTTAIKCSVCGKETKAGEAAHKYTDKADTTCDNAGCNNTRKVEGTENPKTADNAALVLVATLMVASAAAFVCTKKFAR